jgi:hypothetical protein
MLSKKRLVRLCALGLALAATWLSVKDARIAEAANKIIECDYYSDATHTVLVGSYVRVCNGQTNTWGTVTQYSVCHTEGC